MAGLAFRPGALQTSSPEAGGAVRSGSGSCLSARLRICEWHEIIEILLSAASGPAQQFSLLLEHDLLTYDFSQFTLNIMSCPQIPILCALEHKILQFYELTLIDHVSDL